MLVIVFNCIFTELNDRTDPGCSGGYFLTDAAALRKTVLSNLIFEILENIPADAGIAVAFEYITPADIGTACMIDHISELTNNLCNILE